MFPKKERLNKNDFQGVLKNGSFFCGKIFNLRFINNKQPKYSFVTPKNIYKSSVKRNKLRRLGYNVLKKIEYKPGLGVFFYKKTLNIPQKEEIKEEITLLFKKTKNK
jgi:ribonuclease P protein component